MRPWEASPPVAGAQGARCTVPAAAMVGWLAGWSNQGWRHSRGRRLGAHSHAHERDQHLSAGRPWGCLPRALRPSSILQLSCGLLSSEPQSPVTPALPSPKAWTEDLPRQLQSPGVSGTPSAAPAALPTHTALNDSPGLHAHGLSPAPGTLARCHWVEHAADGRTGAHAGLGVVQRRRPTTAAACRLPPRSSACLCLPAPPPAGAPCKPFCMPQTCTAARARPLPGTACGSSACGAAARGSAASAATAPAAAALPRRRRGRGRAAAGAACGGGGAQQAQADVCGVGAGGGVAEGRHHADGHRHRGQPLGPEDPAAQQAHRLPALQAHGPGPPGRRAAQRGRTQQAHV